MKDKKIVILLFSLMVLLSLNFVFAETIISVNYSSSQTEFNYPVVYKTDSAILRITTDSMRSDCVYGEFSPPATAFYWEYGFVHEIHLEDLTEGGHTYYVRCGSEPIKNINFATSAPISAIITLSKEPPLKEGIYSISLELSKTSLETPILKYSFDEGRTYNLISLIGSGTSWNGELIVPGSARETICSFIFEAKDLAGIKGTKIKGESSFVIDTVVPSAIGMINAVGYEGQIKLDWFFEENIKEFNIYRSENPQVDYTEFYKTTNRKYFTDNDVERGKTYYYRIAGVDYAGNIGDLSKEVYATALLNNYSGNSGLNPSLIGRVDNSISEINSVISTINEINSLIELKEEQVKTIFKDIKLDKEIESAISELNSLKRDIESYKLQDLSENELTNKLSSATLRLNIIKKKIPEDLIIIEKSEKTEILNEERVQKAFLEYSSDGELNYNKEISETLRLIDEGEIKINSNFYKLDILYLDGTKKRITLIKEKIDSKLDETENLYFILVVPKEIAEKASELKFINLDYEIIKEHPVILFKSNTEEIIYYISGEKSLNSLEEILISPLKLLDESQASKITGNSIFGFASKNSWGIAVLTIFAFILVVYLLKIRGESSIKPALKVMEYIKRSKELLREGEEEEAKRLYAIAKEEYKTLSDREKRIIIEEIKKMEV